MRALLNLNYKKIAKYGGLVVGGLVAFYYIDTNIKYRSAVNNPVTEYCEMALRTDSRVLSYCGNNFKIKHYEILSSDKNFLTIRLQVSGIRGKCKVLAKCEKHSHKYLKDHFDQQIEFSHLSKEDKNMSPFTPINFNDIFIPDKKLIDEVKAISNDKDIFKYDIDKYDNGYYKKIESLSSQVVKDDDEFWRISSLVLISKDSMVFNVRPISNKLKNYELEDTFYKIHTYKDVLNSIIEFKDKYIATLNKKLTNEEFRREISQMKQSNLERRSKWRTKIMVVEAIGFVLVFIIVRLFLNKSITAHPGYLQAIKVINNSKLISSYFGNNPVVLFCTGRPTISNKVKFNICLMGTKNQGVIKFYADDEPSFIKKAVIKLKNNETHVLDGKVFMDGIVKTTKPTKDGRYSLTEARRNLIEVGDDEYESEKKKKKEEDVTGLDGNKEEAAKKSSRFNPIARFKRWRARRSQEKKINKL